MRKFAKTLAAVVAAFALATSPVFSAYVQTIFNDGTNLWAWSSTSNQAAFQDNGTTLFTVDAAAGLMLPASTVAALPTCGSTVKGAQRIVTDASSPTYNGALTGSSTTVTTVFCNGTAWLSH